MLGLSCECEHIRLRSASFRNDHCRWTIADLANPADRQKNKRRCDGFAPCSNCEFSSRPCLYINAQGEVIPPPRTRDAVVKKEGSVSAHSGGLSKGNGKPLPEGSSGHGSPERNDNVPLPPPHDRTPRKESSSNGDKADKEPRGFVDPLEAVDRDTTLSSELVDSESNDASSSDQTSLC